MTGEFKGVVSTIIWIMVFFFLIVSFYYLIVFIERSRYIDYGAQIRDMAYTTAIDCLEEFSDYQAKSRGVIRLRDEANIEEQVINRFNELFQERLDLWGIGRGQDEVEVELEPIDMNTLEVSRGTDPLAGNDGFYSQYNEGQDPLQGNDASNIDDANLPYIKTRDGQSISVMFKGAMVKESSRIGRNSAAARSVRGDVLEDGLRFRFNLYAQMQHRNLN